jgi:hypothetical protein
MGDPDLGADRQIVGRGESGVRLRGDPAGDSSGRARRESQRTHHWDRALAGWRVHRERGLDTPSVRSGALAYVVSTLLLLDRVVDRLSDDLTALDQAGVGAVYLLERLIHTTV